VADTSTLINGEMNEVHLLALLAANSHIRLTTRLNSLTLIMCAWISVMRSR